MQFWMASKNNPPEKKDNEPSTGDVPATSEERVEKADESCTSEKPQSSKDAVVKSDAESSKKSDRARDSSDKSDSSRSSRRSSSKSEESREHRRRHGDSHSSRHGESHSSKHSSRSHSSSHVSKSDVMDKNIESGDQQQEGHDSSSKRTVVIPKRSSQSVNSSSRRDKENGDAEVSSMSVQDKEKIQAEIEEIADEQRERHEAASTMASANQQRKEKEEKLMSQKPVVEPVHLEEAREKYGIQSILLPDRKGELADKRGRQESPQKLSVKKPCPSEPASNDAIPPCPENTLQVQEVVAEVKAQGTPPTEQFTSRPTIYFPEINMVTHTLPPGGKLSEPSRAEPTSDTKQSVMPPIPFVQNVVSQDLVQAQKETNQQLSSLIPLFERVASALEEANELRRGTSHTDADFSRSRSRERADAHKGNDAYRGDGWGDRRGTDGRRSDDRRRSNNWSPDNRRCAGFGRGARKLDDYDSSHRERKF